ncbi:monovalent cation/H+ antiporter complex subunit F [Actinomadura geliboluensis]|uniref:monovalent cation/H+ antiporter complex subunit F n=1 Tax=Actinomadura geliboluensis TaxID=882440 RepID=UPI00263089AD|nr:monovalent cation/H+ antiporter complex subunit F [Actinomadura geliboluensis]
MTATRPLFLLAAAVLLAGWLPLLVVGLRAKAIDGVAALQTVGAQATLVLICLTTGLQQSSFSSLALITAVCVVVSGLVFARFLDRLP